MASLKKIQREGSRQLDLVIDQVRKTDLNLLTSLYVLIEERSVTKAAQRMLIGQPAMSRVLDRLQTTFEDELLLRVGRKYEPTQCASAIYAELREILPRVGTLFRKHEFTFDPSKATGLFRIEASDFGSSVIIPGLVCILADCAPELRIDVVPKRTGYQGLETNDVDLILGSIEGNMAAGQEILQAEPLLQERLVCLMRAGHPLAKHRLTLGQYINAKHITLSPMSGVGRHSFTFSAGRQPSLAAALERLNKKPDMRVRVPYFSPVGLIVANSDLIATLPLQVARRVCTKKTCIVPAPREFGNIYTYGQVWRTRDDSNATHRLVRGLLRTIGHDLIKNLNSFSGPSKGKILGLSQIKRRVEKVLRGLV